MPPTAGLSATKAAAFIFSILALVSTWVFAFTLYRQYRNDAVRVRLREIRDRVWDLAIEQGWPFAELDVTRTLDYASAAMRAASGMTLSRLLLFQVGGRFSAALRPDAQENASGRLTNFRDEIDRALAEHIAIFPLNWVLRKMNKTWPQPGDISLLVRTAALSVVLTNENRH